MKKILIFALVIMSFDEVFAQNTFTFSGKVQNVTTQALPYTSMNEYGYTQIFKKHLVELKSEIGGSIIIVMYHSESFPTLRIRKWADYITFLPNYTYTFKMTLKCIGGDTDGFPNNFFSKFCIPQSSDCALVVFNPSNINIPNVDFHTDYVEYQGKVYLLEHLSSSLLTNLQYKAMMEETSGTIEEE